MEFKCLIYWTLPFSKVKREFEKQIACSLLEFKRHVYDYCTKMYPLWCQDENLMVECYMNYENIETIYDSCFKAQEDASDISSRERVGSGLCIWKKLGDISVGSGKVFKEGTKHPAPKLKHTGALKMHS